LSNFAIGCSIGKKKIMIFRHNSAIAIFGYIADRLFDKQIYGLTTHHNHSWYRKIQVKTQSDG
jgi:hypothetical protein